MSDRNFREMLEERWLHDCFVCVGLDSQFSKIPESAHVIGNDGYTRITETIVAFNRAIVEATKDLVCAYKPNIAFYEAYGAEGLTALRQTVEDIHVIAPNVPVILDAKRADIGNTNEGYAKEAFDFLKADAITVHPYLGGEALKPFLSYAEKGIIVLCRTSNPGAGEFQDLSVNGEPLYSLIAQHVTGTWNGNGNCALVVGATYPDELRKVRELVGDMPILIPGIGAQGGDIKKTVLAGRDSINRGIIVNSSRGIIFASAEADFAEAARKQTIKLHNSIKRYLNL